VISGQGFTDEERGFAMPLTARPKEERALRHKTRRARVWSADNQKTVDMTL